MDSAPSDPVPAELALIKQNLSRWPQTAGGEVVLINLSENHTFRIDMPDGRRFVLRLHRPRYQSRTAIGSELAWLEAITDQTEIPVPRPIPGADGEIVQEVAPDRFAALFAFEQGEAPSEQGELAGLFTTLGRYAATLHRHVGEWAQPEKFVRPIWDAGGILEPDSPWGDWRKAPGAEGEARETLEALKGVGANVIGAACVVDRSNGKADVGGLKLVSLAAVDFPDYDASDLPPELAKLPAVKPGSRGLK